MRSSPARRPLLAAAVALATLVACGGPPPPSGPTALIDDSDLDDAVILELTALPEVVATQLVSGDLSAIEDRTRQAMSRGVTSLPQASAEQGPGHFALVESGDAGGGTTHRILLFDDTEDITEGDLIFAGTSEVESVAVDLAAELMLFTAGSAAAGLEVYVLDLGGVLGEAEALYRIEGTSGDETDVAMSFDGDSWLYSTDVGGRRGIRRLFLDRATETVFFDEVALSLTATTPPTPIGIFDPSLSGDGTTWVAYSDDQALIDLVGVPVVYSGTVIACCEVPYVGAPDLTTSIKDPSLSEDAGLLLIEEIFDGVETILLVDPLAGTFDELVTNDGDEIIHHPHLTGGGDGLVYAVEGVVNRAEITATEQGTTADPTPVPASEDGFVGFSPYIARAAPPPPPPPPGTIEYSDSTVDGPTWNRPDPPDTGTAGPVGYHAFEWTAEDAGFYTIESEQEYDGFIVLYSAPFDPSEPYTNMIALNDDQPVAGSSQLELALEPGEYVLVTTGFGPGDEGAFTNRIIPPQELDPESEPDIQLFEADLLVLEPGAEVEVTWLAASPSGVTCTIDWGDGTTDSPVCEENVVESATHTYATEGFKVVTLTVTNANGSDEAKVFPTVHADDPNSFDIVVVFANDLLTQTQKDAFIDSAARWSEVIDADLPAAQPGEMPPDFTCLGMPAFNGHIDDIVISAAGEVIDGQFGTLAFAGPCRSRQPGTNGSLEPLPLYGGMVFDIADLEYLETQNGLFSTILHEMGHVLGLGTLWEDNGFIDYAPSSATSTCRTTEAFTTAPTYTGSEGNAQYAVLGGTGNAPIEDEFGPGTKCGHWDEDHFVTELMTGFLNAGEVEPLSILTAGALADLGYSVDLTAADDYDFPPPPARSAGAQQARRYEEVLLFPKR